MKNSQALQKTRALDLGNGKATKSCRKACQGAKRGRNKEISPVKQKYLRSEVRVDGKYIRVLLVDSRNGRVAKVITRRKLIVGQEREVLGIEPGNSNWSVYVSAVRVPIELHRKLLAGMEKALRKKSGETARLMTHSPFGR